MKKVMLIVGLVGVLFMTGCSQRLHTVSSIGEASYLNASQMSWFEKLLKVSKKTLVFTSLVDVNDFSKTSNFGRLYTDLMITQLEDEGWNIIDYRGKSIVTKSQEGEFYLSREKLKSIPIDSSIFVGTYGEYNDGVLLSLRIMRMSDNSVIAASSVLLKDSEALKMTKKNHCKDISCFTPVLDSFVIKVVQDDCTNAEDCEGAQK